MARRDCEPCSVERNQYEDDIVCALTDWLEMVTCIPWIRDFSDGARPDENETNYKNGQYGTICVDTIMSHWKTSQQLTAAGEYEGCVTIENRMDVDITLTVFNTVRLSHDVGTRLRQPADILLRLSDVYHAIPRLSEKLRLDNAIVMTSFGRINNMVELIESNYQRRSSQVIELCVERHTSFADDLIKGYDLYVNTIQQETLEAEQNGD